MLLMIISSLTTAQTKWYKYPGNPVFEYGKSGEWDQAKIAHTVLFEDGQYHMWYKGWSDDVKGFIGVGYAFSPDGIRWQKHEANPVEFEFETDDWAWRFYSFDIIKKDSMYLMWYTGFNKKDSTGYIGFAWSDNGLNWTKHPEPVMKPGKDAEWDAATIIGVKVFFDGIRYHMWYNAYGIIYPSPYRIGYATSYDGFHWEKHPANPVLEVGEPGTWDDNSVDIYSVNFNGSYYEMWYDGYNLINTEVGYARSIDGINWIKSPRNPVLKTGDLGTWDTWIARIPVVVSHDSIYKMWYYGHNNARGNIGYATTSAREAMAWDTATINKPQRIIKVQVFNRAEFIKVDSLVEILPELSGIELINAYNKLALAYSLNDNEKSLKFAEEAMELAKKAHYPEGRAMALYSIGNSQYVMDNYSDALANQLSALWLFDSLDMQFELANLLSQIAGIHSYAGSHDLACRYFKRALDVFERQHDTGFIMLSLIYLGYSYLSYGDTLSAIKPFKRRLSLAEATRDKWKQVDSYEALGICYSGRNLDSALYYFNEANKIRNTLNVWGIQGYNFMITAEAYFSSGPEHYDKAEEYFLKCVERFGSVRQTRVRMLYGMAELYFNTGRYDKAKWFLDISLHACQNFLYRQNHKMFTDLNDKLRNERDLKLYMEKIYQLYYQLDTALNNESLALKHHLLATNWRDSLYNEQNRRKTAMMQGTYETESTQNRMGMLQKENEVKDLQIRQSRTFLISMGGFVVVIVFMALLFIRQNRIRAEHKTILREQKWQHALELEQVESKKLKELDHLKSRFFANISHEFRTPLTLIMGPLEKVLSKIKDDKDKKELGIAKKYAGKLQILINNLLAISKLESGKLQLHASEIDVAKLVKSYLQAFESLAKQKNIELKFSSENEEIKAFIDREKFEQVLNNLLSNAIKFTDEGGRIEVSIGSKSTIDNRQLTTDNVSISISDTGCGIPPEHIDHIFDRFYQVEHENGNYYEGTGIGLALAKELVELHHGEINVESEVGQGSTFIIILPLGKGHLKKEEIAEQDGNSKMEIRNLEFENIESTEINQTIEKNIQQPATNNDVPILLIVEDNADMRSYIRGYFEAGFRIIEAVDGVDGYEKSVEQIPDIIISDVMMPNMDGNVFCRKVKTDERTSHIPVILLTARASKESRIEGLETGADDFITKPFDGEELQVRVKNLINQRKRLSVILERKIQKSHSGTKLDFEDSGITSMDESFLQKVFATVKEHFTDPEFNVEAFCREIGLSRTQLHRKIKALTRQTTSGFIRTFRLKRAAELIKKKSATVAEIAYDVGFNSPSYFSECFRIYFGKLPSEFTGDD